MLIYEVLTNLLLWFTASATDQQSTATVETHAKIVGGYVINIADAPYQVSVRLRVLHNSEYGLGHICGGTVISQRVISSAAHCFALNNSILPTVYKEPEYFVIVAGGTYIHKIEQYSMVFLVQEIIAHEHYRPLSMENDIALVFLNARIPWDNPMIQTLPLAATPYPPNTFCLVSGWGNNALRLQQARVPLMNSYLCSILYLGLPSSQLCAGYLRGGVDACVGDSGGPLVCNGTLAGIVSWGVDCGRLFFPGVYTNVSYYINWIKYMNSSLDYSRFLQVRSLNGVSKKNPWHYVLYLVSSTLLSKYWKK